MTNGGGRHVFESPDGKMVYFIREKSSQGLWKVPAKGGPERLVLKDVREGCWALADRAIFYYVPPSRELLRYDLASRKTTRLGGLGDGRLIHPAGSAVSGVGKTILWVQTDTHLVDLVALRLPGHSNRKPEACFLSGRVGRLINRSFALGWMEASMSQQFQGNARQEFRGNLSSDKG